MKRLTTFALGAAFCCAAAAQQNTTTKYEYNLAGQVTKVTDPLNRVTTIEYDVLGRRTKNVDPALVSTLFGYDGRDQLVQVTDGRNLVTSYSVDGMGNLRQTTSPDTGITTSTYDAAGNVVTRTDAKNQTTTFQYDALNRVTLVTYADNTSATYVYDQGQFGIGRLTSITDVSGSTQYTYTQHGRMASEVRTIGGQGYTTGYRYDNAGKLAGIDYPSGRSVNYVRDIGGRISEISSIQSGVTQLLASQITYQPDGQLKSLVFGNGQTYARTYDLDGRMTSYTLNGQVQTVSYDAASRITGVTDGGNSANNRTYGYDELDRLTSEQRAQRSLGYSYDAVGNRTQYVNGASVTNYIHGTTSNRLTQLTGGQNTSIATDANGSITNNGSAAFNYDARGRMVSANTAIGMVTYKINALGQRVLKTMPTSSTVYHYDQSGRLIAESTGNALNEFVYLGDMPIAMTATAALSIGEAAVHFIHTDQLNTPRVITNVDGTLVWQWDSDPFGQDAANERPAGQTAFVFNQRFPGQQFERESNLHYNYFRDYDPALGRYVESDPIGLGGGINTYGYVLGNPVSLSDQDGLAAGVRVCVNGYCPPLPPGYIDPVTGQPSAAVADEGRSRSRESSSEARSRGRQCPPEDDNKKCNATMSRAAAQAAAYAWAGIAENGKGANSIPWSNFNMPAGMSRSGKEWGDFMRQNYDRPYGYGTPDGNSVTEHPFGHPDQPGPAHHSCPHFHARNRAGVEQIFTYRAN